MSATFLSNIYKRFFFKFYLNVYYIYMIVCGGDGAHCIVCSWLLWCAFSYHCCGADCMRPAIRQGPTIRDNSPASSSSSAAAAAAAKCRQSSQTPEHIGCRLERKRSTWTEVSAHRKARRNHFTFWSEVCILRPNFGSAKVKSRSEVTRWLQTCAVATQLQLQLIGDWWHVDRRSAAADPVHDALRQTIVLSSHNHSPPPPAAAAVSWVVVFCCCSCLYLQLAALEAKQSIS